MKPSLILSSLLSAACLMACDDEPTDATADPLAESWSNDQCYGMSSKPADIETCSTELTFTDGLEFELTSEMVSMAATADYPGCRTTRRVTGYSWSTDQETFTLSGEGSATLERTDCVNEEDNQEVVELEGFEVDDGDSSYSIEGDNLTVDSGPLEGTYVR